MYTCNLNDKLRELRTNHGYSQEHVARHLHLTRQGYAHFENDDTRIPALQHIYALCDLYHIQVNDMLSRDYEG